MQQARTLSGGLAVPHASMAVASGATAHHAEGVSRGTLGPRPGALAPRVRPLQAHSPPLVWGSAAGPGGSWLSRSLTTKGQGCWGVAPSLRPTKPGERGTTHRRDALTRARLMRAGDLTPVYIPQVEDEAMRDRGRAREDPMRALKVAQFQRKAFLLRHAIRYTGRATWNPAPLRWLSEVVWPTPAQQIVCQAAVRAVTDHPERLARLEQALTDQVQTWRLAPVVDALQALRGVPCTVAVTTVAALGDLPRFDNPRQRMHYRGLTPAEYSTGERRQQGGLTKTGPSHARRALGEGAWASRSPAKISRPLP